MIKPKHAASWLDASPRLANLCAEMRACACLTQRVRAALPVELQAHVFAVQAGPTLLLLTDAAVWAQALRFHARDLLAALVADYPGLERVQIKRVARLCVPETG